MNRPGSRSPVAAGWIGTAEGGGFQVSVTAFSATEICGVDGGAGADTRGTSSRFENDRRRPFLLTPTATYMRRGTEDGEPTSGPVTPAASGAAGLRAARGRSTLR